MSIGIRALVIRVFVLGVVLLFAAVSALSWWSGGRGWEDAQEVRVGIYENAPKVFTDGTGAPAGLFVELLEAIARIEDWRVVYHPCVWSDCLASLGDGHIDLMPDVAFSAERSRLFDFHAHAVAHGWSQIYTHPDFQTLTPEGLSGLRVAVLKGAVQEATLDQLMADSGLEYARVPVASLAEAFEAVQLGQADALVTNNFFAGWHNRDYGLVETPIVFNPVGLYFAATKDADGDLLAVIDAHLVRWRADPDSYYYDALRRSMAAVPESRLSFRVKLTLVAGTSLLLLLLSMAALLRWQVRQRTTALQKSNSRLNHLLDASPTVLYAMRNGEDGRFRGVWVSGNVKRIFGFTPETVLRPGWLESRLHPDDHEAALDIESSLRLKGRHVHDYRLLDAEGRIRHVRDEMQLITGSSADKDEIVGTLSDLTQAREQEERLSYLINHDLTTGLPNRVLLCDRLDHALQHARAGERSLALVFIDLDRFKNVNDTLGHAVGDELLRLAAGRIGGLICAEDTLARVGGDEFVILIESSPDPRHVSDVAISLLSCCAVPIEACGHTLVLTASIGISVFPDDGDDADSLLMHAELAMYEAKKRGGNTFQFFKPSLSEEVTQRLILENALRGAVRRGELVVYYQPQYTLATGALAGFEALSRWNHPEFGMVSPARFIALAEEIGIIAEIDEYVLRQVCKQLLAWDLAGWSVPRVAVNLSVQELEADVFLARVESILAETGVAPARLEFEVTESMVMQAPEQAVQVLGRLKALGVGLAMDDFGTGYSSLAYLKRLPLDRLKIDRSFVGDIGRSSNDEAIVRAIIALAASLGLETVAEGVEQQQHVAFLSAERCDIGQGYLLGRPLPPEALNATVVSMMEIENIA